MKSTSRLFKEVRARRGFSIREMAEALGVSPSFYCRIESGKRMPSIQAAMELQRMTGRSIIEHLGEQGNSPHTCIMPVSVSAAPEEQPVQALRGMYEVLYTRHAELVMKLNRKRERLERDALMADLVNLDTITMEDRIIGADIVNKAVNAQIADPSIQEIAARQVEDAKEAYNEQSRQSKLTAREYALLLDDLETMELQIANLERKLERILAAIEAKENDKTAQHDFTTDLAHTEVLTQHLPPHKLSSQRRLLLNHQHKRSFVLPRKFVAKRLSLATRSGPSGGGRAYRLTG